MLSWFVNQVKELVLARKRVVEESDVEIRPERIPSSSLDENVCISSIQKYFSIDAWSAVEQVLSLLCYGYVSDHSFRKFCNNISLWYCQVVNFQT